MALARITIDDSPANIAAMMKRGQFHSHQDGAWRYSPYGAETVYVNDPTAQFENRATFSHGYGAAVCVAAGLVAFFYFDGTRSAQPWDAKQQLHVWQLYGPKRPGEREMREWVEAAFE